MRPDGQEGLTMDHTCRAVIILEEDRTNPAGHKPQKLPFRLWRSLVGKGKKVKITAKAKDGSGKNGTITIKIK